MLLGRFAKWTILLAPFDLRFVPRDKQELDFLEGYPCLDNGELLDDLLDDEIMLVERKS